MIGTIVISGLAGFAFLISVLFSIGDLKSLLQTKTGYPIIQLFFDTTGSKTTATAMTCGLLILTFGAHLAVVAAASRQTWAFARAQDRTLADRLSKVNAASLATPIETRLSTKVF